MASRPRLPRKSDLEAIDRALGDITTKLDKVSQLDFRMDPEPFDDISVSVERISRFSQRMAEDISKTAYRSRNLNKEIENIQKSLGKNHEQYERLEKRQREIYELGKKRGKQLESERRELRHILENVEDLLENEHELNDALEEAVGHLDRMDKGWKSIGKSLAGGLMRQLDRVGKFFSGGILALFSSMFIAVEKGLEMVYELFERVTKKVGEFHLKIGAASRGLGQFTQIAWQVEGPLRGLTDQFGIGFDELSSYVSGFGFLNEAAAKWSKTSVFAARALGVSSESAGQLARSFQLMGQGSTAKVFVDIAESANKAGVSTAAFANEINSSREFMAQFGKQGRQTFLNAASYVKSFGLSLKSLEAFTNLTDTFDSTAQMAAKLNTVFGTSLNSLDLLMEQDPGKRIEMVREQLRLQGKDLSNLTRQEKVFLAEQLKVNADELNGMIDSKMTWDEFQAKKSRDMKTERENQEYIQRAMLRTAQTMFSFGQAWDSLTRHVVGLIKPFTDVLGLTKETQKSLSFGQVMSSVFKRVGEVIDGIAKNKSFREFMREMATDFSRAIRSLSDFVTGDEFTKFLRQVIAAGKEIWRYFKDIAKLVWDWRGPMMDVARTIAKFAPDIAKWWLIMKGVSGVTGAGKFLWNMGKMAGVINGLKGGGSAGGAVGTVVGGVGSTMGGIGKSISQVAAGFATLAARATLLAGTFLTAYEGMSWFLQNTEIGRKLSSKVDRAVEKAQNAWDKGDTIKAIYTSKDLGQVLKDKLGGAKLSYFEGLAKEIGVSNPNNMSRDDLARLHSMISGRDPEVLAAILNRIQGGYGTDRTGEAAILSKIQGIQTNYQAGAGERFGTTPLSVSAPPSPKLDMIGTTDDPSLGKGKFRAKTQTELRVVAGDVILDGKKVGRHIVRELVDEP